jgi:DnaJ-class molecular chaperone
MTSSSDLYRVLGVSPDADAAEIKSAYRRLAKRYHPDRNPSDSAHDRFVEIVSAYDVLGDPQRRALYDEFGLVALDDSFDPEAERARRAASRQSAGRRRGRTFDDVPWQSSVFEEPRRPPRPESSPFQEVFERPSPFAPGAFDEDNSGPTTSPADGPTAADGTTDGRRRGRRATSGPPPRGEDIVAHIDLDAMRAIRGGHFELRLDDGRTIDLALPGGLADGEVLRLEGLGEEPPGGEGPPGDLILDISVEPHELWGRDDLDLSMELPVTIPEALAGTRVEVPTPQGVFVVSIPSGVQSGTRMRLREKGISRGGSTGDFYLEIVLRSPTYIDDELRRHAEALARGYEENVRAEIDRLSGEIDE